jgi:hypothetical protein
MAGCGGFHLSFVKLKKKGGGGMDSGACIHVVCYGEASRVLPKTGGCVEAFPERLHWEGVAPCVAKRSNVSNFNRCALGRLPRLTEFCALLFFVQFSGAELRVTLDFFMDPLEGRSTDHPTLY